MFGPVDGTWLDRFSIRSALMIADLGRAALLGLLCIGEVSGWLAVSAVVVNIRFTGAPSLVADADYQSFIPQLVSRKLLLQANVRLEQSDTVAQTVGGGVAGSLVAALTAPWALLLDAASFLFSGIVVANLRGCPRGNDSPAMGCGKSPSLGSGVIELMRWLYGHY